MDPIRALRERQANLTEANEQILQRADTEAREPTDEELAEVERNNTEHNRVGREISLRETQANNQQAMSTGQGRRSEPEQPAALNRERTVNGASRVPAGGSSRFLSPSQAARGNAGFQSMGDFLMSVSQSSRPGSIIDQRLVNLADRGGSRPRQDQTNIFSNETAGTDGGFSVPPDFRSTLIERVFGEDSLLGRCDQMTTGSNSVTMPVDVDEVWNDSTGIFARWENEGGVKPESKIALDQMTIRLNKLVALVPVSDELLEDGAAIEGYVRRKAPDKINFKVSRSIIAGTGTGQPLGILNSPAKITVSAGAAPSGSIQFPHVADMYGRLYGPFRQRAVWLVNPELDAQLMKMFFSSVPVASVPATPIPVYLPANSVANQPYATLLGRPVIPTQACEPLGTEGDIVFADLSQYLTLVKTGIIKTDVSIHVYFVQDLTAFRFVLRIGGMPWIPAPYTPRAGTFTQSPFVTLQSR